MKLYRFSPMQDKEQLYTKNMKKYFILFCVPAAVMGEWMTSTPPEERKKQSDKMMQDWQVWTNNHQGMIKDSGMPLGKTKRVTKEGIADVKNDLNYYLIVEADSHEAAAEMVRDNPHLEIPQAYVEVVEIPHMGMWLVGER
jgi:hypothetical protein